MGNILAIMFAAFLTENVVLYQIWGVCPFLGVSTKRKNAVGMGLAVTAVIFISTLVTWLLYRFVLVPLNIIYLQILVFILVIASLVQILEMFLKKHLHHYIKHLASIYHLLQQTVLYLVLLMLVLIWHLLK